MADDNKVVDLAVFQASRKKPALPFNDAYIELLLRAFPFLVDDRQKFTFPSFTPKKWTLGL